MRLAFGGLLILATLGAIQALRTIWLWSLDGISMLSLPWAIGEEMNVGFVLLATILIVMGRVVVEAAAIAAEHELTV